MTGHETLNPDDPATWAWLSDRDMREAQADYEAQVGLDRPSPTRPKFDTPEEFAAWITTERKQR